RGIADTGFLVGFANRKDRFHDWALSIAEQIDGPLLTCEAVLAEAVFHIGSASQVFGIVKDGLVKLAFDCSGHFAQLEALAARYADRQPDLAELCLIRWVAHDLSSTRWRVSPSRNHPIPPAAANASAGEAASRERPADCGWAAVTAVGSRHA